MDVLTIALEYHELIVGIIALVIVFFACKYFGTYVEEYVKRKYKEKHTDQCECPAMDMVKEDIPEIKATQKERSAKLTLMQADLTAHGVLLTRLNENVDKLFKLFEEEWKSTISELKASLKDHQK